MTYDSFAQDIDKKHEGEVDRAQTWRRSAGSVSGKAPAVSKLKKVPKDLDEELLRRLIPQTKGCYVAFEPQSGSLRGWYRALDGKRSSVNASPSAHGVSKACEHVLRGLWKLHAAATGESPPFALE